jgi:hypothetical protein
VLLDFGALLTVPALVAAGAGAALGGPVARGLAAAAVAWVALVAVMTQAGYAGNPRYNVAAAAVGCVLAGVGVAALARRDPRSRPPLAWLLAAVLVAGVLAFTAADLSDQAGELGDRADRRTDLTTLIDDAGGADEVNDCAPARTVQPMKAMLAWELDVSMEHLADPPRTPVAVFQAPPGYAGERPEPPVRDLIGPPVAAQGEWTLYEVCELRPSAARTAP